MKVIQFDGANIETKEIKITAENVPQVIHVLAMEFQREFGYEPKAFMIGPNEYGALVTVMRSMMFYGVQSQREVLIGQPETFLGMEIRLKRTQGIEMEFPKEAWTRLALGRVR